MNILELNKDSIPNRKLAFYFDLVFGGLLNCIYSIETNGFGNHEDIYTIV